MLANKFKDFEMYYIHVYVVHFDCMMIYLFPFFTCCFYTLAKFSLYSSRTLEPYRLESFQFVNFVLFIYMYTYYFIVTNILLVSSSIYHMLLMCTHVWYASKKTFSFHCVEMVPQLCHLQ